MHKVYGWILPILGIGFLLPGGCSQNLEEKKQGKQQKKEKPAAVSTVKGAMKNRMDSLLKEANQFNGQGRYAEALDRVRQLVSLTGNDPDHPEVRYKMLDYLHFLLLKTDSFQEALETALELEGLDQRIGHQSPWDCLKIAEAYLGLHDLENALTWIEKAVYERGFLRVDVLESDVYAPLKELPRFKKGISHMERGIGIGLPARDFSIELLDGTPFTLSGQRGRVVLLDFWDVNCPPCRREMPNLKKLQQDFANQGFVLIGISLDTDRALLQNYLREMAPTWSMACSFKGWKDETVQLYKINSTPSSWLIDRQGILRKVNLRGGTLYRAVQDLLKTPYGE